MKVFGALTFIILLAFTGFTYWQVQELRREVAAIRVQIASQRAGGATEEIIGRATIAILQAREALNGAKLENARAALTTAKDFLGQAGKTASEQASPRLKWLQEQARVLGRQVQEKSGR